MKIKRFYEKLFGKCSLVTITLAALIVRIILLPVQSGDYIEYLHPWFLELREHGGLAAVGRPVGNYMVSYIYILTLLTYLPIPDLLSIKAVSFAGDILLAIYSRKLAFSIWKDEKTSNILYTGILFLPTVFLNSGAWAQCDSLYTSALIGCLYYFEKGRPHCAMAAFSVGFVFKLQSVFLAPLLLTLFVRKKVRIRHFLWVPAIYLLVILPAYIEGRPLKELLLLYIDQSQTYQALSMNAPNFFSWFPSFYENTCLAVSGIACAFFITFAFAAFIYRRRVDLRGEMLLWAALAPLFWIPFTLPHMHERYFLRLMSLRRYCFW